jgi:hypothetical protein
MIKHNLKKFNSNKKRMERLYIRDTVSTNLSLTNRWRNGRLFRAGEETVIFYCTEPAQPIPTGQHFAIAALSAINSDGPTAIAT